MKSLNTPPTTTTRYSYDKHIEFNPITTSGASKQSILGKPDNAQIKTLRYAWNKSKLLSFLGSVAGFLSTSYINMVISNYASFRSPSNQEHYPILPDIGFEYIPHIRSLVLTDVANLLVIIPTSLYVFIYDPIPLVAASRLFNCFSIVYILRSLSVAATSLPDPRLDCKTIDTNFFTTIAFHRCGDCIFSGHAVVLVLFSLYYLSYGKENMHSCLFRILRASTWTISILGLFLILANRSHYTVDILIAIYAAAGVWWSYAYWQEIHGRKEQNFDSAILISPQEYHTNKEL